MILIVKNHFNKENIRVLVDSGKLLVICCIMKNLISTLTVLLFLSLVSLQAQDVVMTAMPVVAEEDQTVSVDIQVQNWINVAGAQWSMHWNAGVLNFKEVTTFNLPGSAEGSFGTPPVTDANTLTFSWFDEAVQGVTLDDNSILFTIVFDVVGNEGDLTTFEFDGMPTAIELVNPNLVELGVVFETTDIVVDPNTNVSTIHTSDFALHSNTPNPFSTTTNIVFDLHKKSQTLLSVYSTTGKLLFEQKYDLPSGSHTIPLSRDIFPAAGTYLYRIATDGAVATRKMTLID